MTTKKVKTEAFYIEENEFLENTRVRLNAEVDDKDATLREYEMRWVAMGEDQRKDAQNMKPSTFRKSKVRAAAAEAAASSDRTVTFSDVPTPNPTPVSHQNLNWNTQAGKGGARDPANVDPSGERVSRTYRRNLHARGYNVDQAILYIKKIFKFQRFAALRVVRGVTGWDVF